jgi:RNA polymerase sigma-70 factor (ECF subfamily)
VCSELDLAQPAGFQQAYAAHHRSMYAAAFRVLGDAALAQDAVQDVFLRVWRRPQAFDPSRGDLGAYLRLMARSRALDLWRESQVRTRAADRLQIGAAEPPEPEPLLPDGRDAVRAAVGRLPEPQREAVVLAYWGGLTAGQIARRVQIPLGTAKSRLRLGLARLREELPAGAC